MSYIFGKYNFEDKGNIDVCDESETPWENILSILDAINELLPQNKFNEIFAKTTLKQAKDKLEEINAALAGSPQKDYDPWHNFTVAAKDAALLVTELSNQIDALEEAMLDQGFDVPGRQEKRAKRVHIDLNGKTQQEVLAHYRAKLELIADQIDSLYELKFEVEEKVAALEKAQ